MDKIRHQSPALKHIEIGLFPLFIMVAPRAHVFRPLVKGNEALGTRLRGTWILEIGNLVPRAFSSTIFKMADRREKHGMSKDAKVQLGMSKDAKVQLGMSKDANIKYG